MQEIARSICDVIENGDLCSGLCLMAILFFIGAKMVERSPALYAAGFQAAFLAFLAYVIVSCSELPAFAFEDILRAVLHGLFAGALTLGATWILLATIAFFHRLCVAPVIRSYRSCLHRHRVAVQERRDRREHDRARRQWETEQAQSAPERERQRVEAERFAAAQAAAKASAQRRRENAREACERFYFLHAPELKDRFSREVLDEYLQKYMGDNREPEYVEERSHHLLAMLRGHLEKIEPPPKIKSPRELNAWYENQKAEYMLMPDGRVKKTALATLEMRYAELAMKLVKESDI